MDYDNLERDKEIRRENVIISTLCPVCKFPFKVDSVIPKRLAVLIYIVLKVVMYFLFPMLFFPKFFNSKSFLFPIYTDNV
jgi:hypothetical protein